MNDETVLIVLPLPSPHLHPNRQPGTRGGRMRKYRLTKQYRDMACQQMTDARIESAPWPKASVTLKYYFKDKRRRDTDNLVGWFKAGADGLADAGIVEDDSAFTFEPVTWDIDRVCPRIEIRIRKIEKSDPKLLTSGTE